MIELCKNGAVARIAARGAELRYFAAADGQPRLWSGDPAVWQGVSPNLFPVIGHLKNDTVLIEGRPCAIPMHGVAHSAEFSVVSQSEDCCALKLTDTPETRAVYPFAFALTATHRLAENGFTTAYTVENRSERPMPFTLGGHPGFACPMAPGERFEDYQLIFEQPEAGEKLRVLPGGLMGGKDILPLERGGRVLPLSYEYFDTKDTFVLPGLRSRCVELRHRETGRGLRFDFPRFPVLALWTMPRRHAPYLCLEPWLGLPAFADEPGDFASKPYCVTLAPGERYEAGFGMEML